MNMDDNTQLHLQHLGLLNVLAIHTHLAAVPKGTMIFRAGDRCRHYPVVFAGAVRVCRIGPLGHDVVFYRVQVGEGCAVSASCLIDDQRYPVFGVADEETFALLLPAAVFHQQLDSNTTFRHFVLRQYAARVGALMSRVDSLIGGRPGSRLAGHLLIRMRNGVVVTTHAELAADIGTAREVVSRHLGVMARAGWIRQRRQVIDIVDATALQRLARAADRDAVTA